MWRARASRSAAALLFGATTLQAASLTDPRLAFRSLATEHFIIYFHQGEHARATRLGTIAEDVWREVGGSLMTVAPRRTHVILVDQSDVANGWATPLPRNTIVITAAAPSGSEFIGRTDDWLRLVFTHEFTHIVHLNRSEGWARVVRGLFGRIPVAFPNLFLPAWQIEGLAAWQESARTGQGRLHAGDFRAIEREAARAGRLEPLDRLNGGLTDWPNGLAGYAYGLGFHQYLADRFGQQTLGQLADKTARSLPFLGSRAFRSVYGESLGSLWAAYRERLASAPDPQAGSTGVSPIHRLTNHGYIVIGPRFMPACRGCDAEIVYSVRNPDGFPSLRAVTTDGTRAARLAHRYLGSTSGVSSDFVVFDQQELRRNVGLYSDLFLLDRRTNDVRALTREQRLQDPNLSPDGRTIVSVRETRGRRELVLVHLGGTGLDGRAEPLDDLVRAFRAAITTLASEPGTQFDAPRWSPDGGSVVVSRQRLGSLSHIVVVDVATGSLRTVASHLSARIVTPAWRPDGRAIIAAADYDQGPFDLYEFPLEGPASNPRRLTHTPGGATWPDVSADGATLVFVGYTPEGFDLFTTPYSRPDEVPSNSAMLRSSPSEILDPTSGSPPDEGGLDSCGAGCRKYSPWPTLAPTSWTPIVEGGGDRIRAGLAIAGYDILVRHAYAASATWLVDAPDSAGPSRPASPDWRLQYAYDRWVPTLFVAASRDTAFSAGPPDAAGRPASATRRTHEIEAGLLYPIRRVRATHRAFASLARTTGHVTSADRLTSDATTGARLGWATSTARSYGYSISPEQGLAIGGTTEFERKGFGSLADVTTLTADGRAYLRGAGRHHVIAVRAAAGASGGDGERGRIFHLGGAAANADVLDFGRDAISLLRGFGADTFAGSRVALLNADYRWPIARPQRGIGTVPLFLHTLHAAAFADAGHAWTRAFDLRDLKVAAGGELSLDLIAGYAAPLTLTVGVGWGHDRANATASRTVYLRLGRAF